MRRPLLLVPLALVVLSGCSGGTERAVPVASTTPSPSPTATPTPSPTPTPVPRPPAVRTTPPPAPTPVRTTTAPVAQRWTVARVTAADLPRSWHPGCPVPPSRLRLLTVPFWGFDGARHTGRLVVASSAADPLGRTFVRLYDARFPIRSMRLVDDFGGSDDASMAADNTSAFNCRDAVGGSGWSMHAYGLAVDVDPRENPYVVDGTVRPPEGAAYTDRSASRPGMILAGGPVTRAFAAIGWGWGGRWSSSKDYQHFSANGR